MEKEEEKKANHVKKKQEAKDKFKVDKIFP